MARLPDGDHFEAGAYVDRQLGAVEEAEFSVRLAKDGDLRERVQAMALDKLHIREAAEALDPGPVSLATARLQRQLARALAARERPRLPFAQAAVVGAVMLGAGWLANDLLTPRDLNPAHVVEAVGAHGVFAEDRVRPVEFDAAASPAATAWMSQKIGKDITIPKLESMGFRLVGARMLGTAEGPLAHFVYEDRTGLRTSVLVHSAPRDYDQGLSLAELPAGKAAYWSAKGLNYIVVGKGSDGTMRDVARAVVTSVAMKETTP